MMMQEDEEEERGIRIEIAPETAAEFFKETKALGLDAIQAEKTPDVTTDEDDWDCMLPVPPSNAKDVVYGGEGDHAAPNAADDDGDDGDDAEKLEQRSVASSATTSSSLSYGPPDTLPVVWVNVERLTGYQPSTQMEAENVRGTVRRALWGDEDDEGLNSGSSSINNEDDKKENEDESRIVLARHFEERVTELLGTGIACHADTGTLVPQNTGIFYVVVQYPEYLCRPDGNSVLSTARVWKKLLRGANDATGGNSAHSRLPIVVRRLMQRLQMCSRSLLWKHDMHCELLNLVRHEDTVRWQRNLQEEMELWRGGRRQEQLDKLYTVRETLQERKDQANVNVQALVEERDRNVRLEFQRRRLLQQNDSTLGLEAFDFDSTVFAFPEESNNGEFGKLMGLEDSDDENYRTQYVLEDDNISDQDDEENDPECDSDSTMGIFSPDPEDVKESDETNESDSKEERAIGKSLVSKKERRQAAARKRRNLLQAAATEAQHRAKLEAAKHEEEQVREQFTTSELRGALAVATGLAQKIQQTDELLESLQEEQWADEEENGSSPSTVIPPAQWSDIDEPQLSLLDQVLAMVLGATPPADGTSMEEHLVFLENEHRCILNDWYDYFGRLPLAATSSLVQSDRKEEIAWTDDSSLIQQEHQHPHRPDAEALRSSMGIIDNGGEHWDDDDSDCDEETATIPSATKPPSMARAKPHVVGLRPGGRL
jgi:hypothetical protein